MLAYTTYGTPTEGLFQQPFSKQLDNVLNGKTNGIRDWLPFGQSMEDFQSGGSGAPYSGGVITGIDVRASK